MSNGRMKAGSAALALLPLFFANWAEAASAANVPSPSSIYGSNNASSIISLIMHANPQNLMTGWIYAILGTSSNPTVLASVGAIANVIALMLGVVIVSYIIIGGVLKTAHHGEILGKQWSQVWLPIRIAAAFGLIVPMGAGNMSASQEAVLQMAKMGNTIAEVTWDEAVKEITGGQPIVKANYSLGDSLMPKLLRTVTCDYKLYTLIGQNQSSDAGTKSESKYLAWNQNGGSSKSAKSGAPGYVAFSLFEGTTLNTATWKNYSANFNSTTTFSKAAPPTGSPDKVYEIRFGNDGQCGTVWLGSGLSNQEKKKQLLQNGNAFITSGGEAQPAKTLFAGDTFSAMIEREKDQAYAATQQVIVNSLNKMVPLAKAIIGNKTVTAAKANTSGPSKGSGDLKGLGGYEGMIGKLKDTHGIYPDLEVDASYFNGVRQAQLQNLASKVNSAVAKYKASSTDLDAAMTQGGWPAAGLWYFQISRLSNITDGVMSKIGTSAMAGSGESYCIYGSKWSWKHWFTNACPNTKTGVLAAGLVVKYANSINNEMVGNEGMANAAMSSTCSDTGCSTSGLGGVSNWASGLANEIVRHVFLAANVRVSPISAGVISTSDSGMANPFTTVTTMGNNMLSYATAVIGLTTTFMVASDAVGDSGLAIVGAGGAKALGTMAFAIGMSVVAALAGAGFTLAYGVPFLPIITWIMMLINLLIIYVEAYIAVPLAVIQMATPEGEGISGTRMERAWALMAAIVARPALMVVGLMASISISFVGFAILNMMFWNMARMDLGGFFSVIAILIVYPTFCYQVIKRCVSIMSSLSDTILTWFSSGISGAFTDIASRTNEMVGRGTAMEKAFHGANTAVSNLANQRDKGSPGGGKGR